MNEEYREYYETLGLSTDADQSDVKKAYFRLVRAHPPEKDPELFQKIRLAYERLKDGPPSDTPEDVNLPLPEDRLARYYMDQAAGLFHSGNLKGAAQCLEAALDLEPESPRLLLNLARVQRRMGTPRKAAKTAQKLLALVPDCREGHVIAACGMYDGGWFKKALPEFRKAYKMGERALWFVIDYADDADANDEYMEADRLRTELIQNTKWDRDSIDEAMYIFQRQAEFAEDESDLLRMLQQFEEFLRGNRRLLKPLTANELLNPCLYIVFECGSWLGYPRVRQNIRALLNVAQEMYGHDEGVQEIRETVEIRSVEFDTEITNKLEWYHLLTNHVKSVFEDDERLQRYSRLDCVLNLIREGESARTEAKRIRENYPLLYGRYREYIDLIASGETEEKYQKYLGDYARLSESYEGGSFYQRHPEEKKLPRGVLKYNGDTPFVRETKKPGRNDPCPCGSGKKFKRCCIGKGIYD